MTYEEKIAFCKEHLGENMGFLDHSDSQISVIRHLRGLDEDEYFLDEYGSPWPLCRVVQESNVVPWTLETAESVQLRHKPNGNLIWMNYGPREGWYVNSTGEVHVCYSELLEDFETADGRPCGTVL